MIFNSDDQLIGNVGRGWVKLIPVQIATPLLEDSLMTEIAREIQLLQKQTDIFNVTLIREFQWKYLNISWLTLDDGYVKILNLMQLQTWSSIIQQWKS